MSAAYTIRPETRDVLVDGAPVSLGARAFDVLAYLDTHRDRVVSKAELLEQVWGGLTVEEGNLTVQISALRKVLGLGSGRRGRGRAVRRAPEVTVRSQLNSTPYRQPDQQRMIAEALRAAGVPD